MEEAKKEKFIEFEKEKRAYLQDMIADAHNDADHEYLDDPDAPGTCVICDWLTKAVQDDTCPHCGRTAKAHVQDEIDKLDQTIAKTEAMDEDEWQQQVQNAAAFGAVIEGLAELVAVLDVLDEFIDE